MINGLPEILMDEKYKDTWEWDGWKPKAKPDAPQEVKDAIEEMLSDMDTDESSLSDLDAEFENSTDSDEE